MVTVKDVYRAGIAIVNSARYDRAISYLLLLVDCFFCYVIVKKVPYTEIDWEAYMQQIEIYRSGERDYAKIKGGTGPLVYPAGHVYIFNILYQITDGGKDKERVAAIFGGVYILTLWLVMKCYRLAKAPPWIFPLLILSKRLHSIYLLRFFNDCFSVLFMYSSIYLMQKRYYQTATIIYSLSVSVKMSSLLFLPAVGIVLFLSAGPIVAIQSLVLIIAFQLGIASDFLTGDGSKPGSYWNRAFEFSRQFLWEWTANWRFMGEDNFSSQTFQRGLTIAHVMLLSAFIYYRWLQPSNMSIPSLIKYIFNPSSIPPIRRDAITQAADARFVLTALLTCNTIGMLCARSLHYQFYSWLAWGTPFLLWASGLGPLYVGVVWLMQEYAWNVFPSTPVSSAILVTAIALQIAGVWRGTRTENDSVEDRAEVPNILRLSSVFG